MELIKQSALYSLLLIIAIPLIGFVIHLLVSGLLARLFGIIDRSGRLFLLIANTLTFPGVMYHELSHALFALITGAKVNKIVLYNKEGDHLGYVNFSPRGNIILRSLQLSFSACAPVIMGLIGECVIIHVFRTVTPLPVWGYILLGFLLFCIILHMDMSGADIKGYVRGIPFFFLLFMILFYLTLRSGATPVISLPFAGGQP